MSEVYDYKQIAHEHDVLKSRVDQAYSTVMFDSTINIYTNLSQGNMGAWTGIDLSAHVPSNVDSIIAQLYLRPSSNAYWRGRLSRTGTVANANLDIYSFNINRYVVNMGHQKLSSTTVYYLFERLSGAGLSTAQIRLYGYTVPI